MDGISWTKSSHSAYNGNCVEAARDPDAFLPVLVRDSKQAAGPVLKFTDAEWREFIARVKAGELDLLSGG